MAAVPPPPPPRPMPGAGPGPMGGRPMGLFTNAGPNRGGVNLGIYSQYATNAASPGRNAGGPPPPPPHTSTSSSSSVPYPTNTPPAAGRGGPPPPPPSMAIGAAAAMGGPVRGSQPPPPSGGAARPSPYDFNAPPPPAAASGQANPPPPPQPGGPPPPPMMMRGGAGGAGAPPPPHVPPPPPQAPATTMGAPAAGAPPQHQTHAASPPQGPPPSSQPVAHTMTGQGPQESSEHVAAAPQSAPSAEPAAGSAPSPAAGGGGGAPRSLLPTRVSGTVLRQGTPRSTSGPSTPRCPGQAPAAASAAPAAVTAKTTSAPAESVAAAPLARGRVEQRLYSGPSSRSGSNTNLAAGAAGDGTRPAPTRSGSGNRTREQIAQMLKRDVPSFLKPATTTDSSLREGSGSHQSGERTGRAPVSSRGEALLEAALRRRSRDAAVIAPHRREQPAATQEQPAPPPQAPPQAKSSTAVPAENAAHHPPQSNDSHPPPPVQPPSQQGPPPPPPSRPSHGADFPTRPITVVRNDGRGGGGEGEGSGASTGQSAAMRMPAHPFYPSSHHSPHDDDGDRHINHSLGNMSPSSFRHTPMELASAEHGDSSQPLPNETGAHEEFEDSSDHKTGRTTASGGTPGLLAGEVDMTTVDTHAFSSFSPRPGAIEPAPGEDGAAPSGEGETAPPAPAIALRHASSNTTPTAFTEEAMHGGTVPHAVVTHDEDNGNADTARPVSSSSPGVFGAGGADEKQKYPYDPAATEVYSGPAEDASAQYTTATTAHGNQEAVRTGDELFFQAHEPTSAEDAEAAALFGAKDTSTSTSIPTPVVTAHNVDDSLDKSPWDVDITQPSIHNPSQPTQPATAHHGHHYVPPSSAAHPHEHARVPSRLSSTWDETVGHGNPGGAGEAPQNPFAGPRPAMQNPFAGGQPGSLSSLHAGGSRSGVAPPLPGPPLLGEQKSAMVRPPLLSALPPTLHHQQHQPGEAQSTASQQQQQQQLTPRGEQQRHTAQGQYAASPFVREEHGAPGEQSPQPLPPTADAEELPQEPVEMTEPLTRSMGSQSSEGPFQVPYTAGPSMATAPPRDPPAQTEVSASAPAALSPPPPPAAKKTLPPVVGQGPRSLFPPSMKQPPPPPGAPLPHGQPPSISPTQPPPQQYQHQQQQQPLPPPRPPALQAQTTPPHASPPLEREGSSFRHEHETTEPTKPFAEEDEHIFGNQGDAGWQGGESNPLNGQEGSFQRGPQPPQHSSPLESSIPQNVSFVVDSIPPQSYHQLRPATFVASDASTSARPDFTPGGTALVNPFAASHRSIDQSQLPAQRTKGKRRHAPCFALFNPAGGGIVVCFNQPTVPPPHTTSPSPNPLDRLQPTASGKGSGGSSSSVRPSGPGQIQRGAPAAANAAPTASAGSSSSSKLFFSTMKEALESSGSIVDRKGVRGSATGQRYLAALQAVASSPFFASDGVQRLSSFTLEEAEALLDKLTRIHLAAPLDKLLHRMLEDALSPENKAFVWSKGGSNAVAVDLLERMKDTSPGSRSPTPQSSSPRNPNARAGTPSSQRPMDDSDEGLARVQALLCQGAREEAVEVALQHRLYTHAILIAMMCPTKESYVKSVQAVVQEALQPTSPLAHAYCVFNDLPLPPFLPSQGSTTGAADSANGRLGTEGSGPGGESLHVLSPTASEVIHAAASTSKPVTPVTKAAMTTAQHALRSTWRQHAAMLVSNFNRNSGEGLLRLGDDLLRCGFIPEAHTCFLLLHLSPLGAPVARLNPAIADEKPPRPDQLHMMEQLRRRLGVLGGYYHPTESCRATFLSPVTTLLTDLLQEVRLCLDERVPPRMVVAPDGSEQFVVYHGLPARPPRYAVAFHFIQTLWLREVGMVEEADRGLNLLLDVMPAPSLPPQGPPSTVNELVYVFGRIAPPPPMMVMEGGEGEEGDGAPLQEGQQNGEGAYEDDTAQQAENNMQYPQQEEATAGPNGAGEEGQPLPMDGTSIGAPPSQLPPEEQHTQARGGMPPPRQQRSPGQPALRVSPPPPQQRKSPVPLSSQQQQQMQRSPGAPPPLGPQGGGGPLPPPQGLMKRPGGPPLMKQPPGQPQLRAPPPMMQQPPPQQHQQHPPSRPPSRRDTATPVQSNLNGSMVGGPTGAVSGTSSLQPTPNSRSLIPPGRRSMLPPPVQAPPPPPQDEDTDGGSSGKRVRGRSAGGGDKDGAANKSRRSRSIEAILGIFRRGNSEGKKEEKAKPMILDTAKVPEFDPVTGRWMLEETEEEKRQAEMARQGPPKMPPGMVGGAKKAMPPPGKGMPGPPGARRGPASMGRPQYVDSFNA